VGGWASHGKEKAKSKSSRGDLEAGSGKGAVVGKRAATRPPAGELRKKAYWEKHRLGKKKNQPYDDPLQRDRETLKETASSTSHHCEQRSCF